ncbi:hypothetical protein I4U23_012336 [Adineta vaga]|nr:hypothetical protein I4U23_012336 [Adineta vaga]
MSLSDVDLSIKNTIKRAIESIDDLFITLSEFEDVTNPKLDDICSLFEQLFNLDLSTNRLAQLFFRQLERLLNYNSSIEEAFWNHMNDDILYILENEYGKPHTNNVRETFLDCINLEEKLIQREMKFQQIFGRRKELNEILGKHELFFKEYLENCICFHSKIQIHGLVADLDRFLNDNFGLTQSELIQEKQQNLDQKLKHVEIPLNCSGRLLSDIQQEFFKYTNSQKRINNSFNSFIPSAEPRFNQTQSKVTLFSAMQSKRWLIILGDPGSSKTSILRWIACCFAEAAYSHQEEVIFENNRGIIVRIPILIRIGEFASWLEQNRNKTLIDYIGKHTWFSQPYTCDDNESVLRELIHHGHALILLDGLDEIPDIQKRKEIVDLVSNFMNEYVFGSDFILPSDDGIFEKLSEHWQSLIIETEPPSMSGGNQILVTSRIVGFHLCPFANLSAHHYSLSLLKHNDAKKFVKEWTSLIQKSVVRILIDEEIEIDLKTIENITKTQNNSIETLFENGSQLLLSNPSLLSLISMMILQTSQEIKFKSRVQVYNYAIEIAFNSEEFKSLKISKNVLYHFLINLATYLHLQSPSGLIDTFDLEHLCCVSLRQLSYSNKRKELQATAAHLINLLKTNNGIVDERGLNAFGFLHLSFQEYFVSQYFVSVNYSIEELVKHILSFGINPRFRESLRMTLEWISWKWSFDDYNQFYHPYSPISETYLIPNLCKLSNDIIIEWMELNIKTDHKRLFTFCKCLRIELNKASHANINQFEAMINLIYQKLSTFYHINTLNEFIIDQLFRTTIMSEHVPIDLFNNELSAYLSLHGINASDLHPVILSIIISICGGICFDTQELEVKINFSTKYIHRQSSVIPSIIKYLANNKESHSTKLQLLIKEYESIVENALSSDTSIDLVDAFVTLVCLKGLSESSIYKKYGDYQALSLAFTRLKRTWFYLKQPFEIIDLKYDTFDTSSLMSADIESIIKLFLLQTSLSDRERISISIACAAAVHKLCYRCSLNSFTSDILLTNNISPYLGCQPEFSFCIENKYSQLGNRIYPMQLLQDQPYFLLMFLPQSLQKLYYFMSVDVEDKKDSMPLVVLFLQCLLLLEEMTTYDLYYNLTLKTLQAKFEIYMLENYALMLSYRFSTCNIEDYDSYISVERQRIHNVNNLLENQEKDIQLLTASCSLARIFRSRANHSNKLRCLSIIDSEEVRSAIMHISDTILRIIGLSIITDMQDPLVFDKQQRDEVRHEMIYLLQSVLPTLPLLTSTLLYIRCYNAHEICPIQFQQMGDVIGEKLNTMSTSETSPAQEAAFIALQQLNISNISNHLLKFIKHTQLNLSELFRFNSSAFCRYFTQTECWVGNPILLSIMYLTELAFDSQYFKINSCMKIKNKMWYLKQWKQLWRNTSRNQSLITFKVATWITIYVQDSNKAAIYEIIDDIARCLMVERNALPVIEKWLCYRNDETLRFFSHYAALQLVIEGSKQTNLIDLIVEIFYTDKRFHLKSLVERLFTTDSIDITVLRLILIKLKYHVYYLSQISICIIHKSIFQLILSLEIEQIISDIDNSSEFSTYSLLSLINRISQELQLYLLEHLHVLIDEENKIQNNGQEKYVATLIKWIIQNEIWNDKDEKCCQELYRYSLACLSDQRSQQIQKAALNGFNHALTHNHRSSECYNHLNIDPISRLENIIGSFDIYSEDNLAICLLAYGNYLIRSKKTKTSYNISDKIQNNLKNLFETSPSETISVRSAFCLIIAEQPSFTLNTILDWFKNKCNLTPDKQYKFMLEKLLYQKKHYALDNDNTKDIVAYIKTHAIELHDKFVQDLYNYLCSDCTTKYLSDPTPDYIFIVSYFSTGDFNEFRDTIRRSYFGEENFKRLLYQYFLTGASYSGTIIGLYASFGVFTLELVEMLTWITDTMLNRIWQYIEDIKEVSDRSVVEKLFQQLGPNAYNTKFYFFEAILRSLIQLAQAHVISLSEIHQYITVILRDLLNDDNSTNCYRIYEIIKHVSNLSCIESRTSLTTNGYGPITENDIDEDFQRAIQPIANHDTIVYSFGSNNNFDFEKAIKEELPESEIHTFDKNLFTCPVNLCTFHRTYLGDGRDHVEGSEFQLFEELISHMNRSSYQNDNIPLKKLPYIRRILLEIHLKKPNTSEIEFRHSNYAIFHKEANIYGCRDVFEYAFIRLNSKFFM